MTTNTTRRGLIRLTTTAAACVAGASIVSGGAILAGQAKGAAVKTADRSAWDRAFAAFTKTKAEAGTVDALYDATPAGPARDALAQKGDHLGETLYEKTWTLFAIPAPDHAALLWKTEYLFGDPIPVEGGSASWAASVMATYLADARRLLGNAGA